MVKAGVYLLLSPNRCRSAPLKSQLCNRNMKNKLITSIILLFATTAAFATKPCPPSPCVTQSQFDKEKCVAASNWIATGEVKKVIHNYSGEPLNKDFASFIFFVKTQEKGKEPVHKELHFTVGWCDNPKPLPKDTSGLFRFYGITYKSMANKTDKYEYLHFEHLGK